jgi:hypothetical protein
MKPSKSSNTSLTRRHWLVLTSSALTGCGGGGSLLTDLPGTGGTGSPLFAQGSITGFGSVIINGIKFDETHASVQVDGLMLNSDALRLGMVAGVRGERNAVDSALGTATAIEVWSIAQGPVTRVGSSDFDVMGMSIQTDTNTSLDGFNSIAALSVGKSVQVWGLQAGDDGRRWVASRVAVQPAGSSVVTTGLVKDHEDTLSINDWQLSGAASANLKEDQLVRVQGTAGSGNSLVLTGVKLLVSGFESSPQGSIEIEGVVTRAPLANRFLMGPITVDASATALASILSTIAMGTRVEVYGEWVAGVLVASQLKLEDSQSRLVEIDARIDTYNSPSQFVLRGQLCDASSAQFVNGTLANLKQGIRVKVTGNKVGDVLQVITVKFAT